MTQTLPTPFAEALAQRKKRDRTLLVAVVIALGTPLFLVGLLLSFCGYITLRCWHAYKASTAYVLSNNEAIADFGGALDAPDAHWEAHVQGSKATVSFNVAGPAGSALVTVVSHRSQDRWQVDTARYERAGRLHDISPRP